MKLKYQFEMMDMDDQKVAVPLSTGERDLPCILRLNETASDIFELLQDEISEEELIEKLGMKYTASSVEEITGYVKSFLKELRDKDFLD